MVIAPLMSSMSNTLTGQRDTRSFAREPVTGCLNVMSGSRR